MSTRKPMLKAIDISLAAMFAALMAIGANIGSFLVVGGVPITLQTFVAILAGALLGSRLGAISMTVYTLIGLVGVPVFSKFGSGIGYVFSPSFGFVISFIIIAYVIGKMIERQPNPGFQTFLGAAFTGLVINYIFGTNCMYLAYKFWASAPEEFSYWLVWMWMLVPLPKDILLTLLAVVISPRIYRNVQSSLSRNR